MSMLCCETPGRDVCRGVVTGEPTPVSDSCSAVHPPHRTAARDERDRRAERTRRGLAAATRSADDGGMVTAELAASLPVLVLLLAVALSAVSVGSLRVRAQDAAREAARAAARGDSSAAARLAAEAAPGASVRIETAGDLVTAVASVRAHLLVPFLPAVTVTERAVAAREPSP